MALAMVLKMDFNAFRCLSVPPMFLKSMGYGLVAG